MTLFRVRWEKAGGDVHCRLFVANGINQTYANCGKFVVSAGSEFDALRGACPDIEFVDDTNASPKTLAEAYKRPIEDSPL